MKNQVMEYQGEEMDREDIIDNIQWRLFETLANEIADIEGDEDEIEKINQMFCDLLHQVPNLLGESK